MTLSFDDIQKRESRHVLQTYRRQPVAFVRGKGPRLYDVDGREYLVTEFVDGTWRVNRIAKPGSARGEAGCGRYPLARPSRTRWLRRTGIG